MRRGAMIAVTVLLILAGIAIGVGAYHAGQLHSLTEAGQTVQVVHVVGPGYGFFPFGILLFPLFLFAVFMLLRVAFWGRRWGGPGHRGGPGHMGPGSWGGDRSKMIEDWHRRQHEQASGSPPPPGGEPQAGEQVPG